MDKAVRKQLTKLSKGVVLMVDVIKNIGKEEIAMEVLEHLRLANLFLNSIREPVDEVSPFQNDISSVMTKIRDFYFPGEDE
ncbi:hypothetical protein EG103P1_00042 [Enterococcus phage EG103P1]|nr:hypothetical protein EG103P1_00042 [Enterococcus phage EG103P1]